MMGSMHEAIYGDVKRVREARVQAQGRIAARRLRAILVDQWAEPLARWLVRQADRMSRR